MVLETANVKWAVDRIFTEGFVWLQSRAGDLSLITKVVDAWLVGRESNGLSI